MGVVLNLGEGWPPVSLLYPLRYLRKKRDPGDNVGSTQPRLDSPPPFSVFLLVPDSVKRQLASNSPGLVDLDRASEFSS